MAPASMELSCTTGGCKFVTPAMELALALQYMKFHQEDHHTQKEQDLWTVNWILQSHRRRVKHFGAPVCQEKDSEDAAAQKEQVKANKLARRRKQKAKIAKASNSIEEVESKAHKMDGAEVQVSISVEVAPDISTREMVIQQVDQHEGVMVQEVVIKPVNTAQPAQQIPVIQQGEMFFTMVSHQVLH